MLVADHPGVIMCKGKKKKKSAHLVKLYYCHKIIFSVYCVTGSSQSGYVCDVHLMFILLYCVPGLSQSDNIHDVHFIVLCSRTEPK